MTVKNEDLIGSILPNINISRIMLFSDNIYDSLYSNVQFILKDTYGKDDVSSWLEDSDILKYYSVVVMQVADPILANAIELALQKNSSLAGGFQQINNTIEQLCRAIIPDLTERRKKFIKNTIRPFANGSNLQTLLSQGRAEQTLELDKTIYNIYFDTKFERQPAPYNEFQTIGLEENTSHLSYLFFGYYDLTSLLQDTQQFSSIGSQQQIEEIIPRDQTESLGVSEVVREDVIINGELLTQAFVYLDQQQNIWPGQIHAIQRSDGAIIYRSGQTEDRQSFDLTRVAVENYKVQDFRLLKRIREISSLEKQTTERLSNLTDLENSTLASAFSNTNYSKELAKLEEMLAKNENSQTISDAMLSVNKDGFVTAKFSLDYKKMFLENTVYGAVLNSLGTTASRNMIDYLYSNKTSIEYIILREKRIDLDENLILQKQYEKEIANIKKGQMNSVEKGLIFPQNGDIRQLRNFSIKSKEPRKVGKYEYSVEIGYLDNTKDFINEKLNILKLERIKFNNFYEIISNPAFYNPVTDRIRLESIQNDSFLLSAFNGNYDFRTAGSNYLRIMRELFQVDSSTIESYIRIINNWIDPVNCLPASVYNVVKLYDNMISVFEKSISLTTFVNNSLNEKGAGIGKESASFGANSTPSSSSSKIVSIKKKFSNTMDLNSPFSMEYFSFYDKAPTKDLVNDAPAFEGLKVELVNKKMNPLSNLKVSFTSDLDLERDNQRINEELKGIFQNHSNLIIRKKITSDSISDARRVEMPIAIENYTPSLSEKISVYSQTFDNTELEVLNTTMIKLLEPTVSLSDIWEDVLETNRNSDNLYNKINTGVQINFDTAPDGTFETFRHVRNLFGPRTILSNLTTILLPNQIKALLKLKTSSQVIPNDAIVRFKYELLKQIEYLDGFEFDNDSSTFNLEKPIWKKLDRNPSSLFPNGEQRRTLLCKISDYFNTLIKYKFNKTLSGNTLNSYFHINNTTQTNDNTSFGATISVRDYEARANLETLVFFDGNPTPSVLINLANVPLNNGDSYTKSYYTYFSPVGFIFDNKLIKINDANLKRERIVFTGDLDQVDSSGVVPRNVAINTLPDLEMPGTPAQSSTSTIPGSSRPVLIGQSPSRPASEISIRNAINSNKFSTAIYSSNKKILIR